MKTMNYKILIIKSGAVIVDLPENPKYEDISAVFADKAKQIRFKDENDVNLKLLLAMLLGDGDFLKVGQTFDLPDNLGVSFESCKMCEGTGQYEKPYQQFIKCNYCSNGKLVTLTPITEAPVKSEGEKLTAGFMEEGESQHCSVCGSYKVLIRGKFPKDEKRRICPTCTYERLEQINEISSENYGKAYSEPKLKG